METGRKYWFCYGLTGYVLRVAPHMQTRQLETRQHANTQHVKHS